MTNITLHDQHISEAPSTYTVVKIEPEAAYSERFSTTAHGQTELVLHTTPNQRYPARTLRTLIRKIVRTAKKYKISHLALAYNELSEQNPETLDSEWLVQTIAENLSLANYEFTTYHSKEHHTEVTRIQEIRLYGEGVQDHKVSFSRGLTIADGMNLARDLTNTPGADLSPSQLVNATKQALKDTPASVKTLDASMIRKAGMGLLDAVGKGAHDGPVLILIEYWGAGKTSTEKPLALIGKGITFDSGGLNVKPAGAMHDMHMDMGGGGAVIGAMSAIAKLGIKRNIIAVIPAAENAISATSMRAGDIATAMNGTTVEITHTDAEGRLVLADAMTYAERTYQPHLMIDVATLTGAALVALGQHAAAVMTDDMQLQERLVKLGEHTGDLLWPLPLWPEYKEHIQGTRGDITNIAANFQKWGGAIEGGTFLSHFAPKNTPWAHIDIAPRMDSVPSDQLAKGATGEPVRVLVALATE